MSTPSPLMLLSGLLLMGFLECGDDEWGAHPGEVCAGPEFSLVSISQGADLSGWWTFVPESQDGEAPLDHDFLLIDQGLFPRAWSQEGGKAYKKYERNESEWAFGCESYLDFPLVVGQENRSPAESKLRPGSCQGHPSPREPSARRFLVSAGEQEGMVCYHYDYLAFKTERNRTAHDDEVHRLVLCFGYDPAKDQMKIRYARGDNPVRDAVYIRYFGDGGDMSSVSTTGPSSSTALETSSESQASMDSSGFQRGAR